MPVHPDDIGFESLVVFADISDEAMHSFSVENPGVTANYAEWTELRNMLEEALDRGGYKRDPRHIARDVVTNFSEGYCGIQMTHKAWQALKAHIAEAIVNNMRRIEEAAT